MFPLLLEAVLLEEKLDFRERAAEWICSPGTLQIKLTSMPSCSLSFAAVGEYKFSFFLKLVQVKNTCNINNSNEITKNNYDEQRYEKYFSGCFTFFSKRASFAFQEHN